MFGKKNKSLKLNSTLLDHFAFKIYVEKNVFTKNKLKNVYILEYEQNDKNM